MGSEGERGQQGKPELARLLHMHTMSM